MLVKDCQYESRRMTKWQKNSMFMKYPDSSRSFLFCFSDMCGTLFFPRIAKISWILFEYLVQGVWFHGYCLDSNLGHRKHYHLQADPKKLHKKKPMLFLASMGEIRLSHDIFLKFSLRPFQVFEVDWWSMLNFEAATSKFCNCSWKFGS